MMRLFSKVALLGVLITSSLFAVAKPNLIFYCGITMIPPMQKIAKEFEQKNNCAIKIVQGRSEDLYDSLKLSKKGDLYLPGSDSYIKGNL